MYGARLTCTGDFILDSDIRWCYYLKVYKWIRLLIHVQDCTYKPLIILTDILVPFSLLSHSSL